MTVYTAIADSEIDPESPGTTTLFTKNRNNPIAQGEGDSTVPAVQRNIKHLIATATASASATIDFSNVLSSAYSLYVVELINVIPSVNASTLLAPVQTGGSTWQTGAVYTSISGTSVVASISSLIKNTAADGGVSGFINIPNPSSAVSNSIVQPYLSHVSSTSGFMIVDEWTTMYQATTAVTGIRFVMNSGNITSGTFRLYGISA